MDQHRYKREKEKKRHTGFKLELSGEDVHHELDERIGRAKDLVEQDEANHDWPLLGKAEALVQRVVADKHPEHGKHEEEVELRNQQQPRRVAHLPVSEFVRQHRLDLLVL